MIKRKSKPINSWLRKSAWSNFLLFLLIANFINLSANFYEGNILISNSVRMEDPIDTLSELIFEWALDGNDDLIPDNGTQQDDNSLEKIKLALLDIPGFKLSPVWMIEYTFGFSADENLVISYFSDDSPPPDRC